MTESLKEQGNAAFEKGDYNLALDYYTKAIESKNNDNEGPPYILHMNRSAVHLKLGNASKALEDAQEATSLNPEDWKGYYRLGAAYYNFKDYSSAKAAYKLGLENALNNNDSTIIEQALQAVRMTERQTMPGAYAANKVRLTQNTLWATSTNVEPSNLRNHVQRNLQAWQAQADLLHQLKQLTTEQKLQLLFTQVDLMANDKIHAHELATVLRKPSKGNGVGGDKFLTSIEKAISVVAIFDHDGDAALNFDEFTKCLQTITDQMSGAVTLDEMVEYILIEQVLTVPPPSLEEAVAGQYLSESLDNAVHEREELLDLLVDPRVLQLFQLFDKDNSGVLSFQEVAVGLYQLSQDAEGSARQTTELLLALDHNDRRTLDYEHFGRLLMAVVASSGATFDEVSQALTEALTNNNNITEQDYTRLLMADAMFEAATDLGEELKKEVTGEAVVDALSHKRLHKLFDLYDANGDGVITFQEMVDGLRSFQSASNGLDDAVETAIALFGFDDNADNQLDRQEFAKALASYAKLADVPIHDLIDFMCVSRVLQEDGKAAGDYQNAWRKAGGGDQRSLSMRSSGEFSLPFEEEIFKD